MMILHGNTTLASLYTETTTGDIVRRVTCHLGRASRVDYEVAQDGLKLCAPGKSGTRNRLALSAHLADALFALIATTQHQIKIL